VFHLHCMVVSRFDPWCLTSRLNTWASLHSTQTNPFFYKHAVCLSVDRAMMFPCPAVPLLLLR
jgi:hypothetical protein